MITPAIFKLIKYILPWVLERVAASLVGGSIFVSLTDDNR